MYYTQHIGNKTDLLGGFNILPSRPSMRSPLRFAIFFRWAEAANQW